MVIHVMLFCILMNAVNGNDQDTKWSVGGVMWLVNSSIILNLCLVKFVEGRGEADWTFSWRATGWHSFQSKRIYLFFWILSRNLGLKKRSRWTLFWDRSILLLAYIWSHYLEPLDNAVDRHRNLTDKRQLFVFHSNFCSLFGFNSIEWKFCLFHLWF